MASGTLRPIVGGLKFFYSVTKTRYLRVPFGLLTRLKIEVPDNNPVVLENLLCSNSGHKNPLTFF